MDDDRSPNPYAPPKHEETPPPRPSGEATLFVRRDERLPELCLKCGKPGELVHRTHTFVTQPPRKNAMMLGVLFGALGGAVAGAAAAREQKTAKLDVPLCGGCNTRWDNGRWLLIGAILLTGVGVLFMLLVGKGALSAGLRLGILFGGFASILGASAIANKSQLSALHIDDEGVVILGVSAQAKMAVQQALAAASARAPKKKRKKAKPRPDDAPADETGTH